MMGRRIYVASSWRNEQQPAVISALRAAGHEVYDFRNPAGRTGFGWRQATDEPPPWSAERTREVLALPISQAGFDSDFDAMKWADTFVMLQPCGRSAALELGWACGAGKQTVVLLADGQEPELMLKCAQHLCTSLEEVLALLAAPPESGAVTLRGSVEVLHDAAAQIFRDEIDDEWEQLEDGTSSNEDPTIALLYRIDTRRWQAAIVYDSGMGTVPLLAGNSEASPEAAVASLTAEIEADATAATDEADG